MFTGIVQSMGRIASISPAEGGARLWVEAGPLAGEAKQGDSVAVDGCCLTVVGTSGGRLAFDAIPETLRRTTLGRRAAGDAVNLELPLRPVDRLGGHFVQGHVDAVAEVLERREQGADVTMTFRLPPALGGQVVEKGSVAIDGVSLTVASADARTFSVALIPHTLAVTTLGRRGKGDLVNLEGDILAKYVAALVARR
ncbi:MAG TPA: riboflavin synthase [Planctomycetota bacterium]|nr:riboflavin synthase [Planctomycetota bacterium]